MKLEQGVHGEVSNFAGTDWHLIDLTNPPSPDTQKEMGRLEKAWKKGSSRPSSVASDSRSTSLSRASNRQNSLTFSSSSVAMDEVGTNNKE